MLPSGRRALYQYSWPSAVVLGFSLFLRRKILFAFSLFCIAFANCSLCVADFISLFPSLSLSHTHVSATVPVNTFSSHGRNWFLERISYIFCDPFKLLPIGFHFAPIIFPFLSQFLLSSPLPPPSNLTSILLKHFHLATVTSSSFSLSRSVL